MASLDTGSTPLGVHFGSKHGAAWCKAIWLDHPEARDVLTLATSILSTDSVRALDTTITAAERRRSTTGTASEESRPSRSASR